MLTIPKEFDLHVETVRFIREKYPEALLVPGLGEFQVTSELRQVAWLKGYTSGQPDLLILSPSHDFHYSGFAIEFKHPNGKMKASAKQLLFLGSLKSAGFKTLVSHDFKEVVTELAHFFGASPPSEVHDA